MNSLERQLRDEIEKANFSIFEITGFQNHPELALLAGAAIGYRMALNNFKEKLWAEEVAVTLVKDATGVVA